MGVCVLLMYLLVHISDQISDILTALIYLAQGYLVEGVATLSLVYLPGLVVLLLELKEALRGKGNIFRGVLYMIFSPVYTWITVLYSLYHTEWREKAMFLVVLEGFLAAAPQLVLQLSLWFNGSLTAPALAVLDELPGVVENLNPSFNSNQTHGFQFLGREYSGTTICVLGLIQVVSILCSFISVLASGVYFNELETRFCHTGSAFRKCVGIPFFVSTILFRALALSLVICILQWWSSMIIFIFFFVTVLTSLCAGDRFGRSCLYGVWCSLVPVGFSRDPLESLGFKVYHEYSIAECAETNSDSSFLKKRARYFLNSHSIINIVLLLPALILATVLANQAGPYQILKINHSFILPIQWINIAVIPGTGILLGISLLLSPVYQSWIFRDIKAVTSL
ncbi:uncharacterized protein LOC111709856 [Eurytemora carolleeae]|uniref:uncharacterized protein LOC111709856 n=1 Tax=Eurytemora carolleeae TaxID=1294199 RepID=UPI000C789ADB|nr:uncharacterized protein LOC111709856 [Eurytemora carolleeae]|eukprot:XP_023339545.1 uncharacterized protein LOC111709856 [Eurytemora affinis]